LLRQVVIDLPEAFAALRDKEHTVSVDATPKDLGVDTGKWECIERMQSWATPGSYMGVSLACQGSSFRGMQAKKKKPKSTTQAASPHISAVTLYESSGTTMTTAADDNKTGVALSSSTNVLPGQENGAIVDVNTAAEE